MTDVDKLWDNGLNGWSWQIKSEFTDLLKLMQKREIGSVIEIGCYDGGTAAGFLALGCSVVSVDIAKRPRVSELETTYSNYHFFKGTSEEYVSALQSGIEKSHRFDMAFIDGDHSYDWALRDYRAVRPLIPDGGLIVFHDIVDSPHHRKNNCEVYKLWQELKVMGTTMEFCAGDIWGGIGVYLR